LAGGALKHYFSFLIFRSSFFIQAGVKVIPDIEGRVPGLKRGVNETNFELNQYQNDMGEMPHPVLL